jgi:hypothetical protein
MTETQTPTKTQPARWSKHRDKYGRTCYTLNGYNAAGQWRNLCSLCRLPKSYIELHPGQKYLANDWLRTGDQGWDSVTYHLTLAAAKAHLLSIHPQPQGISEFSA